MKIEFENEEKVKSEIQSGRYVVACIHRSGNAAYIGVRNYPSYGSHEPLLNTLSAPGIIDDYWRCTFNAAQGASILFVIPEYVEKKITPSEKATNDVFESYYNATRFWQSLSSELSQRFNISISSNTDLQDPHGLWAYYKAQMMKGLTKQAQKLEKQGNTEMATSIKKFVKYQMKKYYKK